ncbi:MAG: leucyl/phenylalanyl-tRNA--protein transferase [Phycisphaerae bacterium]|jgi:leucyl/phenylalanyl-tRNA--protein transferase
MNPRLTPDFVLSGYRAGVFPMADDAGDIYWYSPDPRTIFDLEGFKVSRSLRKTIQREVFEVRVDTAFDEVIAACADRPEGTWISTRIMKVYSALHRAGHAHSVESWQEGRLAGGLYGVSIGGAFFGESMFYRVTDASKVALAALVTRLRERGFRLLDTQWTTRHLEQFGVIEVSRRVYLSLLRRALARPCTFVD